jgi:ribosomal protein L30E
MAKKKEIDEQIQLLKEKIKDDKIIIGAENVFKSIKTNKLNKIFLSSNCPQKNKEDILHYAKLIDLPVVELKMDNEELGVFCKKNFFVSVIGVIKE